MCRLPRNESRVFTEALWEQPLARARGHWVQFANHCNACHICSNPSRPTMKRPCARLTRKAPTASKVMSKDLATGTRQIKETLPLPPWLFRQPTALVETCRPPCAMFPLVDRKWNVQLLWMTGRVFRPPQRLMLAKATTKLAPFPLPEARTSWRLPAWYHSCPASTVLRLPSAQRSLANWIFVKDSVLRSVNHMMMDG